MDRTERFYRIEMLIRRHGGVSFEQLQQELEVSRATLKRDLQYLRERMDAPIVYSRFDNLYQFENPTRNNTTATRHQLPGLWFSETEIHALLTMHQLIEGLDAGGVLGRHLQPLLDKLHTMLGQSEQDARDLMRRVRIVSPARRPVAERWFEAVGGALLQRRRLLLNHYSRSRQTHTEREVSPQRLIHYRNTWYLDAWCHLSDGLRRFAMDAVDAAHLLEHLPAQELSLEAVATELDGGYGIFTGQHIQTAVLRFNPEAAQWVAHEEWHPAQQQQWLPDGSLELRLPYADPTELAMDILRHGAQVQVLGPPELAQRIAGQLAQALALYSAAPAPVMPDHEPRQNPPS